MDNNITMDAMIGCLGRLGASAPPEEAALCKEAVNVLFAFLDEGAKTPEDVLDIIHDYRAQSRENASLRKKHLVAGKPILKDSVWHCPDCNRRVVPNHSYCHRCGKKLGWRV